LTPKCATCRFFEPDQFVDAFDNEGACHRRAPLPRSFLFCENRRETPIFVVDQWPIVSAEEWCGEWEVIAETKAQE